MSEHDRDWWGTPEPPYGGPGPAREEHPLRDLLRKILAPIAVVIGVVVKFGVFSIKFFNEIPRLLGYAALSLAFLWNANPGIRSNRELIIGTLYIDSTFQNGMDVE